MQKYYAFSDSVDVTPDRFQHYVEVYLANQVEPRIAELENALRNLLALVDEIDTSSGEEVKGVVYYEAKKMLGN
jgi:hypothetical protein